MQCILAYISILDKCLISIFNVLVNILAHLIFICLKITNECDDKIFYEMYCDFGKSCLNAVQTVTHISFFANYVYQCNKLHCSKLTLYKVRKCLRASLIRAVFILWIIQTVNLSVYLFRFSKYGCLYSVIILPQMNQCN
jgi:hypothetical protein